MALTALSWKSNSRERFSGALPLKHHPATRQLLATPMNQAIDRAISYHSFGWAMETETRAGADGWKLLNRVSTQARRLSRVM